MDINLICQGESKKYKQLITKKEYVFLNEFENYDKNDYEAIVAFNHDVILGICFFDQRSFRDDKKRIYISTIAIRKGLNLENILNNILTKIESIAQKRKMGSIFCDIDTNNLMLKYLEKFKYKVERINLKKTLLETETETVDNSMIHEVSSFFLKEHMDDFAKLYLINDRAHIFSESSSLNEAQEQMNLLYNYLNNHKAYVYAWIQDNEIAGVLWAFPYSYDTKEHVHVKQITVKEKYRGNGLAEKIYIYFFHLMRKKKNYVIITNVDAINKSAIRLYEKLRYKENRYQMVKNIKLNLNNFY